MKQNSKLNTRIKFGLVLVVALIVAALFSFFYLGARWTTGDQINSDLAGSYYPDYSLEPDPEIARQHMKHTASHQTYPVISLSRREGAILNTRGVLVSGWLTYCRVNDEHIYVIKSYIEDSCEAFKKNPAMLHLRFEFPDNNRLTCVNCQRLRKPTYWYRSATESD